MFKLDLEKAEEPEIKLPTSVGSQKKQESSRKTPTSDLLTIPKPLTVWITTKCGNSEKDGNTRPPYLFLRNLYADQKAIARTEHGKPGSKLGKVYAKAAHCHPAYLTYM